ncbi:MAG: NAD(+)/NADH kinase [Ruminococcaceae bacterium]|nr:NAD(+)/NADH kinase [Oscillospiraceae bacterium]
MAKSKIVIATNPFRDDEQKFSLNIIKALKDDGHLPVLVTVFDDTNKDNVMFDLEDAAKDASLIISVGGDGTFLHVARRVFSLNIPVLGVNMGTKGFLASLEGNEIEYIRLAAKGEYRISRRMLIDYSIIRSSLIINSATAINDVVIKSDISCIGMSIFSDDAKITHFSGDGVIVATPTGSTAYSMSAGGPLVEPEASNLIVTPICAHAMANTSFVLSPQREIIVLPERLNGRRAFLSVDGQEGISLNQGDRIVINKSEQELLMADMGIRSFYTTVFRKLSH